MAAVIMAPTPSDPTGIDLFCGAGGGSRGAEEAGLRLRLGVNHWPRACQTYAANHPDAQVECADLQHTSPERYQGYATDLLLGSPECRRHSGANGKQRTNSRQQRMFYSCDYDPEAIRSRATMWEMQHFLAAFHHRYVVLENVVEARHWDEFATWLQAMDQTGPGYRHKLLYLNSMFFGAPQSRDRLYIVFWRKDMPAPDLTFTPQALCWQCREMVAAVQSWKDPARPYGKYGRNGQYVYRCPRCARETIPLHLPALVALDWSLPTTRIGERAEPLAEATIQRIRIGLAKWRKQQAVMQYIQQEQHDVGDLLHRWWRSDAADEGSVSVRAAGAEGAVDPQIVEFRQHMSTRPVSEALTTVTAQAEHHGLLLPPAWLAKQYSGVTALHPVQVHPTGSITTVDHHAVLTPPLAVKVDRSRDVRPATTAPLWTITGGGNHLFLCLPPSWLVPYYGTARRVRDTRGEPCGTLTGDDRYGLLHGDPSYGDLDAYGFRMLSVQEIQRAMQFPDGYQILGNQREQVKQLGNAVTTGVMRWLVDRVLEAMLGRPRTFDPAVTIRQTWQWVVSALFCEEVAVSLARKEDV